MAAAAGSFPTVWDHAGQKSSKTTSLSAAGGQHLPGLSAAVLLSVEYLRHSLTHKQGRCEIQLATNVGRRKGHCPRPLSGSVGCITGLARRSGSPLQTDKSATVTSSSSPSPSRRSIIYNTAMSRVRNPSSPSKCVIQYACREQKRTSYSQSHTWGDSWLQAASYDRLQRLESGSEADTAWRPNTPSPTS